MSLSAAAGQELGSEDKESKLTAQSGLWVQIPVRDEVSSEDASQYLINPVTGSYLRMP